MRTESLPCLARLQLTEEDRMACRKSRLLVLKIGFTRFLWEVARDLSTFYSSLGPKSLIFYPFDVKTRAFVWFSTMVVSSTETVFFKLLRSPGIDYMESIPSAYVAWQTGPTTLILLCS
jgi:hypothetical protein